MSRVREQEMRPGKREEIHTLVHIEVVMTNAQRLPQAFYMVGEHWTYLQSFIFRIARLSSNKQITQAQVEVFDELREQARIIDYCIKVIAQ